MNITGHGQYSKQTAGIKDQTKIMNQQQKLVFIYPMLFADKIKVQTVQSFESLVRDFISVTFLSDIFIQNTFNIIGIANQIRPLWDENRQAVDPTAALIRTLGNQQQANIYTSGPSTPNYPIGPEHTPVVQSKINQKTAVIQHLIKTDPKLAKLRPFIEVITMGNMIDVPVIVGTANYPVDTLTLMYVLIAAIGLNRKLTNSSDLEIIFKELESMDEAKYWRLLNSLTKSSDKDKKDMSDYFRGYALKGLQIASSWRQSSPAIARTASNLATKLQKRIDHPPDLNPQKHILAPLLLNKTDLDQTKLYFKFVLDPGFAKKRFGIDASNEQSKLTDLSQAKLQGELTKVQDVTMSAFTELVGVLGTSLLLSISNIISLDNSSVDVMEAKSTNIDKSLFGEINDQLNEILIGIDNGLKGSSAEESRRKIKILKELCKIDSTDTLNDYMNQTAYVSIVAKDFDIDKFKAFSSFFDSFANVSNSLSTKIQNQIEYISTNQEKPAISLRFDALQRSISKAISGFFDPFIKDLSDNPDDDLPTNDRLSRLAQVADSNSSAIRGRTIPAFLTGLTKIFYFIFLAQLQASLCKFILVADVDIETSTNEVTAWPNYTLVLPVEIIVALHAAIMGSSWQHMLSGGQIGQNLTDKNKPLTKEQVGTSSMIDVNDSYTKAIIKYVSKRLDVPNLIVVDSRKGDIYYKLMNQTDINKTKITTIDTFIQSKLNRQMISQF